MLALMAAPAHPPPYIQTHAHTCTGCEPEEKKDLRPLRPPESTPELATEAAEEPVGALPAPASRLRTCGHSGYHFLYSVQGSSFASWVAVACSNRVNRVLRGMPRASRA
jgi:hypothetical protein